MASVAHRYIVKLNKTVCFKKSSYISVLHTPQFIKFLPFYFAVPEAPIAVKALVYGAQAILISWRPPSQPNGIISQYTVYSREEGSDTEPKKEKVPPYQMSYEAGGLDQNKPYEFWVTGSTNIGEGQASKSIIAIPNDKVPAKIASFDDTFTATFKEDAKLPCLAVGSPNPNITWKVGVASTDKLLNNNKHAIIGFFLD